MPFMQPYVYRGQYFEIETSAGTEIVPADVIGRTAGTACEAFANYVEGRIVDPDECAECKTGFLARMSAPGYMDCTDWSAHETEREAREYLAEMYGDDDADEYSEIGDSRVNPDGSVSTLVDNGDGTIGTLTKMCAPIGPVYMTRDGRIVGPEHPDALK